MVRVRFSAGGIARSGLVLCASLAFIMADLSAAVAQNTACTQISAILQSIERNPAYASQSGIAQELGMRQQQVRQDELQWINGGCQQQFDAGGLSQQCRSLAQTITLGRNQVQQLQSMAQEGQTLVQNHRVLAQDYQRYNCGTTQSGVTFGGQDGRGSLLDNMFGRPQDGNVYVERPYDPWSAQQTRRTVCVRTCDGFFWPISFSTTDEYVAQDAIQCHEMCPGTEVALFSYRNPGEEPEDMISLSGTPYRSMPYAFRFRTEVDMSCSCNTREPVGTVTVAAAPSVTSEIANTLYTDETVLVPLPRPRPREDGTAEAALAGPEVAGGELRIVNFGDRQVRIVGPQTPYVPREAEEP